MKRKELFPSQLNVWQCVCLCQCSAFVLQHTHYYTHAHTRVYTQTHMDTRGPSCKHTEKHTKTHLHTNTDTQKLKRVVVLGGLAPVEGTIGCTEAKKKNKELKVKHRDVALKGF